MKMFPYHLMLILFLFCLSNVNSEHRKLIPKCMNSCLNGPKPENCFCDSKCSLIYNDCCLDAPYRSFRVNTQRIHNIHCVFVHGENKNFWMVDTCKDTWSGHELIKKKCENSEQQIGETSDVMEAVPVTSPEEEVTYKNYYCGLCNDENTENLVEWKIKALCASLEIKPQDILKNVTYVEDKQQWGVWKLDSEGSLKFHECHLLFQRPEAVTSGIRQCVSNMVSTCPSSWRNIGIRRRCKSYLDPIKWSSGPVYKNIDCAACNNMTEDGFQCVYDKIKGSSAALLTLAMSVDMNSMGQWF